MRPLWWLALGAGAAGGAILIARRPRVTSAPPPEPAPPLRYGELTRVALSVPAGWRRVTSFEVTPELRAQAELVRSSPGFTSAQYGTLSPFVASDGRTYATWIEQHYHEPGGPAKPWGLHHGVTLLAEG